MTSVECAAVARQASRQSCGPASIGAAIDDQAVAPDRHLQRQRAGMGEAVDAGRRRRAAIDDQHGAAGLHALEPALGHGRRAASAAPGLGQHQVDQRRHLLARAVEQRQAAIAVAQRAQRRRHALDGGGQRRAAAGSGRPAAARGSPSGPATPPDAPPGCARHGSHRAAPAGRSPAAGSAARGSGTRHGPAAPPRRRSGPSARSARGRPAPPPAARRPALRASPTSRAISFWRNRSSAEAAKKS